MSVCLSVCSLIFPYSLQLYDQLGIDIVLTQTITFTVSDPFPVGSSDPQDPSSLLDDFTNYVIANHSMSTDYDSMMLMT